MFRRDYSILSILLFYLVCTSCGGGGSNGGGNNPPPAPTITSVALVCNPTSVQVGQTSQCSPTVTGTGSFNSAVNWSADTGSITSAGLFTAPNTAIQITVKVTATSVQDPTKSNYANITVTIIPTVDVKAAPRVIAVIVSPEVAAADTGGLVQQLATSIESDYRQKTESNDPVVSAKLLASPSDVAGVLALLQSVDNLWGAMLIGNVPVPWDDPNNLAAQVTSNGKLLREFKAKDIAGLQKFAQSVLNPKVHFVVRKNFSSPAYPADVVAFDAPYKAPNCSGYVLGAGGEIMQFADPSSPDPNCVKKNWVAHVVSNNGVDEVSGDSCKKDIDTRHSNAPLQKYAFERAAWFGGQIDPDYNASWVNNALYAVGDIGYVDDYGSADNSSASRLQDIKNLLEDGTEFVAFNVHGGPDEIMIEGAGTVGTFYSNDVAWLTPDDLYQSAKSCANNQLDLMRNRKFSLPGLYRLRRILRRRGSLWGRRVARGSQHAGDRYLNCC